MSGEELRMFKRSWFWDRLAKRYAGMPIPDQASYEAKLEKTRTFLRPDSRVLEFGCGTASTAILHAPHVALIHAIDYSPRMLEIARAKATAAGVSNLSFAQATLAELDSPPDSWDVILGMSILHLLPDRLQTLARVHELLKPGGLFISSTICIGDAAWQMRVLAPLLRALPLLPSIASLSLGQLKGELVRAGFKIEECWRPGANKAALIVARKRVR
ncbi:class I SAM-dependent methyltransferase [Candidatus Accumulibacter sp. ACC003]|uniref:class I SAM-dependent methyltransferase n=1 Tax=Candidatus Accumulibacter sp. ACC003 TaxID=2823334 RepID=UPI0025BD23FC|nr:class I SAM-dependent methyltransferase [Candidatus Accumulibacter sp. ACC003]